jgi:hypothetical protein
VEEEAPACPLPTPHRVGGYLIHWIWDYFAVKRGRIYLAGLLIGLVGASLGALLHPEHGGSAVCAIVAVGASGVGAVWFLSFAERLSARLKHEREEGNPTFGTQILFIMLGLAALVVIAVCVVGVCALFL